MILGLQNEDKTIQTETRKMADTMSNYHKQLQEQPPINMARRRAINKMKKNVKEMLQNVEVTVLNTQTLTEEVKEAIKQT